MQARYYDPVIGRFYSNDPVGYTSVNPVMSFNRYLYVNNNPYKYTDPEGEFLNFALGAIAGAIAEVAVQAVEGKGFDGGKIAASALIGGATSGLSSIKLISDASKLGKAVMTTSIEATGAATESMVHDAMDGNIGDFGDAGMSALTSVPGIGNASTVGKIVNNEVTASITQKTGSEFLGDTAGDLAAGVAVAGVKSVEALGNELDKQQ